jgi:hypothetical protein
MSKGVETERKKRNNRGKIEEKKREKNGKQKKKTE